MAWYYPVHSCGHEAERIQLYGPHRNREYRLKQIEAEECPQCRAEKAQAQTPDLPPLQGSPKQIAWATDIRADVLKDRAMTLARLHANEEFLPYCVQALTELTHQTNARFWIDIRDDYLRYIAKQAALLQEAQRIANEVLAQ